MTPNLGKYVNKTILVSIPALSGDIRCRPYKLTGVELIGLWLDGADLASGFLTHEHKAHTPTTWAFFIPYSQIACVAIGTTPVAIPVGGKASAAQSQLPAQGAPSTIAGGPSSSTDTAPRKKPKAKEG